MITVYIYEDKGSNIRGVEVMGHADYAEYGNDIVCASVSMLTYTLVNYLVEVVGLNERQLEYKIEEDGPLFKINILDESEIPNVKNGLEFYRVGIESLFDNYGDNINLLYREV